MEVVSQAIFFLIVIVGLVISIVVGSIDPLMDSHPYSITWGGPLELNKKETELLGDRHVTVTTNEQEHYHCILPQSKPDQEGNENHYSGPSATELLLPMFSQSECSYRIESYWTYELCHGKHLKQSHETREPGKKPKVQEYFLGFGNHRKIKEDTDKPEEKMLPVRELDGNELPYYEVIMTDGTKCDLTNQPRKAHVLYVCFKNGRGEVYELKEISTCEYEVLVLTDQLCKHPDYKPKPKAVSEIRCHAFLGSPTKPSHLVSVEQEGRFYQAIGEEFTVTEKSSDSKQEKIVNQKPQEAPSPMVHKATKAESQPSEATTNSPSTLGTFTDKQTLRDFFSGNKCLRGGHGWWKHEICYGKYAKQFHIENGKETSIYLGFWELHEHLKWLKKNPLKRPKESSLRKHVSQHYTNGDLCDLTRKARTCEVRLKCIQNTKNPHAVMLSLAEPAPCQYVLTVDSALFCPILKNANNDGLFENLDL